MVSQQHREQTRKQLCTAIDVHIVMFDGRTKQRKVALGGRSKASAESRSAVLLVPIRKLTYGKAPMLDCYVQMPHPTSSCATHACVHSAAS